MLQRAAPHQAETQARHGERDKSSKAAGAESPKRNKDMQTASRSKADTQQSTCFLSRLSPSLTQTRDLSLSLSTSDSVLRLGQTLTDFFNGAPFNDGNNQPPTTSPKDCHHNAFTISRLLSRPPLSCLLARWEVCKQETRANAQVCAGNCRHSAHCWHSFHQDLLVADATCNAGGASSLSQWASWNRIVLGGNKGMGSFKLSPWWGSGPI